MERIRDTTDSLPSRLTLYMIPAGITVALLGLGGAIDNTMITNLVSAAGVVLGLFGFLVIHRHYRRTVGRVRARQVVPWGAVTLAAAIIAGALLDGRVAAPISIMLAATAVWVVADVLAHRRRLRWYVGAALVAVALLLAPRWFDGETFDNIRRSLLGVTLIVVGFLGQRPVEGADLEGGV